MLCNTFSPQGQLAIPELMDNDISFCCIFFCQIINKVEVEVNHSSLSNCKTGIVISYTRTHGITFMLYWFQSPSRLKTTFPVVVLITLTV